MNQDKEMLVDGEESNVSVTHKVTDSNKRRWASVPSSVAHMKLLPPTHSTTMKRELFNSPNRFKAKDNQLITTFP